MANCPSHLSKLTYVCLQCGVLWWGVVGAAPSPVLRMMDATGACRRTLDHPLAPSDLMMFRAVLSLVSSLPHPFVCLFVASVASQSNATVVCGEDDREADRDGAQRRA